MIHRLKCSLLSSYSVLSLPQITHGLIFNFDNKIIINAKSATATVTFPICR